MAKLTQLDCGTGAKVRTAQHVAYVHVIASNVSSRRYFTTIEAAHRTFNAVRGLGNVSRASFHVKWKGIWRHIKTQGS